MISFKTAKNSSARLEKVMNDNKGNFVINKDGYVSANLQSPIVQKRIYDQIMKLKNVKV